MGRFTGRSRNCSPRNAAQVPGLAALEENARLYYERFSRLAASGDVPVQERDNRAATYREASAKLGSLRSEVAASERQVLASELGLEQAGVRLEQRRHALSSTEAAVVQAQAAQLQPDIATAQLEALESRVNQGEAALRTAQLNLSRCVIRAPQGGIVSRRTIQLGETLAVKQSFLSIVPLDFDNVWVVANLREDQMDSVQAGNRAQSCSTGSPRRLSKAGSRALRGAPGLCSRSSRPTTPQETSSGSCSVCRCGFGSRRPRTSRIESARGCRRRSRSTTRPSCASSDRVW